MSRKKPHPQPPQIHTAEPVVQPSRSLLSRWFSKTRLLGIALTSLGLYLISDERIRIARTGHGGSKSAAVPLILSMGIAYVVDPDFRRLAVFNTMAVAGLLGGVVWYVLWH